MLNSKAHDESIKHQPIIVINRSTATQDSTQIKQGKSKKVMEDALTEAPPPSRFFNEDLNNFTPPSPPLPSPFLLFSTTTTTTLRPSLLIISISSASIHLLHHLPSKTLIGTLILPEIPLSPLSLTSPNTKSIDIYSLSSSSTALFVSFPSSIPAERSHAVAKLLLDRIRPEKTLIFESVQSRNFRGRLAPDEGLGFKIETSEEKLNNLNDSMLKGFDWFPSGSVIDGLAAAILSRCELMKMRASLFITWPESGNDALLMVKSVLERVLPNLEFGSGLGFDRIRDSRFDSELYT